MALIECPECGKKISDKAPACPGCGLPLGSKEKAGAEVVRTRRLGGCLVFLLIFLMIVQCIGLVGNLANPDSLRQFSPNLPSWHNAFTEFDEFLSLIACLGVFKWKRWGVILFFLMSFLMELYGAIFISPFIAMMGLIIPLIFLALIWSVWDKMDGAGPPVLVPGKESEKLEPEKPVHKYDVKKFGVAFCVNCGAKREKNIKTCPNCGTDYDS